MKTRPILLAICVVVLALLVFCRYEHSVAINRTSHLIPYKQPGELGAVEEPRIVAELSVTPTINETLRWWTGSWAMGDGVKYYRPLTSLFWWLQYRAFGENGVAGFLAVLALPHAIFALMLWGFLHDLAGLKTATAATLIYVSSLLFPMLGFAVPMWALERWIDQPEAWYSTAVAVSLWAFLRFAREENRRWLAASIGFFVMAILFKESAYVTPFLALALLWHERRLRLWRGVAALFAVLGLAIVYRAWALQGSGFLFGTNGAWLPRMVSEIAMGALSPQLFSANYLPFSVGFALMAFTKRQSKIWLAYGAFAAFFYLLAESSGEYFGEASERLLLIWPLRAANAWIFGFQWFAILWMFHRMIERRDRLQIFAYLWVLVAYLPMLRAPITNHGLYFLAVGWALWAACVVPDALAAMNRLVARSRKQSTVEFDRTPIRV